MEIYKQYVERILEAADKWEVEKINLNTEYDLLTLKKNPGARKSVSFSAGIHGDEPAGPEAVIKFVKEFEVPDDIFVMIFPVVNPYGFNRHARTNALRQDINRRFCDKLLAGEAKIVYDLLIANPVSLFCSLHEWSGSNGFYMYASDKIQEQQIVEIPKLASRWFEVFDNRKINNEDVVGGVIWHPEDGYSDNRSKCTLENRVFSDGTDYLCIETPGRAVIEDRVECQFNVMKYIIDHLI